MSALITDRYRDQQAQMHADVEHPYGVASAQFAASVAKVIDQYGVDELLDYGSGSRLTLINTIAEQRIVKRKFAYRAYDPAVEMYSATPEPTEMVACLDVLEHIEPLCLDSVLDDLKRVTKKIGFFTVSTVAAAKKLPDGRNAHLIIEPAEWWLPQITARFKLQSFQRMSNGFIVLVSPAEP